MYYGTNEVIFRNQTIFKKTRWVGNLVDLSLQRKPGYYYIKEHLLNIVN